MHKRKTRIVSVALPSAIKCLKWKIFLVNFQVPNLFNFYSMRHTMFMGLLLLNA